MARANSLWFRTSFCTLSSYGVRRPDRIHRDFLNNNSSTSVYVRRGKTPGQRVTSIFFTSEDHFPSVEVDSFVVPLNPRKVRTVKRDDLLQNLPISQSRPSLESQVESTEGVKFLLPRTQGRSRSWERFRRLTHRLDPDSRRTTSWVGKPDRGSIFPFSFLKGYPRLVSLTQRQTPKSTTHE